MQLLYLHVVPCKAFSFIRYTMLAASLANLEGTLEVVFESALSNSAVSFYTSFNKFKVLMRVLFSFTRKWLLSIFVIRQDCIKQFIVN